MSVFTADEIAYLEKNTLGRLATVGLDGQPHVIPLSYRFNQDEDTIDLGGIAFGEGKKWRDATNHPLVTFLVDDADSEGARAVEIRGTAELHQEGGDEINPRFPNFAPEWLRLRPTHIVSWGVDGTGQFVPYSRRV